MKKTMTILSVAVSTLLLSGCGAGATTDATEINKQPHDTSKLNRGISIEKDWTWSVDVRFTNNRLYGDFYDGFPDEIKHNQYFIDSDNDVATGYTGSNGWEINGADYIIEDNQVYKSLSNTEWRWEHVGKFETLRYSNTPQSVPGVPKKQIKMSNPDFDLNSIFKNSSFKVMMEFYNENWNGNYNTVTGIEVEVKNGTTVPDTSGKRVTREELDTMIRDNEDYSKVDVSGITDMSNLFDGKKVKLDITGWDVSNVTNMENMFARSELFNQPIGNWDVSKVTNMENMFYEAETFNQPIGNWDTGSVTTMKYMFSRTPFNQPIGNWDVSNVTLMSNMFKEASLFNQDIDNWNVSKVTNMESMFYEAASFNQPIGNWNVSKVTDMSDMFDRAQAFNQPIGNWDTGSVTTMSSMFYGAPFNQPIGNWDVSKVTHMNYMFSAHPFRDPAGIESMLGGDFNQPIGNWDVGNVTSMDGMFRDAKSFNQPIGNWDVGNVADMSDMFKYASSFNQDISSWNVSHIVPHKHRGFSSPNLIDEYKPKFNQN